ncbi:MAG: L-2-amino-thiazoline-4-carboxylic acid hydrolase [Ruminococcus sp.]
MLKYGIYAKAVELLCFQPALEKLSAVYPEMDIKSYKKNVKHEYKNMLLRTPDIEAVPGDKSVYRSICLFSAQSRTDKITPAIVDAMVTAVFDSPFMIKAHKNKKCTLFTDKVQDKKVKESIASQTSEYALDWKFRYEKGVDEFYNTYTECGICKLGIRENCFEFVPCLCNMDERNYRNEGGQLHRTKTLAQGDDCCDFHVTKIKSES